MPCRRARRAPRDLPAQGAVTQTDRLCAARTGQRAKDRGQTPPEQTGTVQHDNQNVPRERSRPAELQCLTLLPKSGRNTPGYLCAVLSNFIVAVVNLALSFVSGVSRSSNCALAVGGGLAVRGVINSQFWRRIAVVVRDCISLSAER